MEKVFFSALPGCQAKPNGKELLSKYRYAEFLPAQVSSKQEILRGDNLPTWVTRIAL